MTRRQAETVAGVAPATFARLASDGSILERVAHGVYHLTGAPTPDHLDLRAAWLQLAPDTPAWERTAEQGVVSRRSAAALYGLGHLPADNHEFTLPSRRQSRRSDVRLHRRHLDESQWIDLRGLPVTRPSRIAADLLLDREDPEAVGHLVADGIRGAYDDPGTAGRGHRGIARGRLVNGGVSVLRVGDQLHLDGVGHPGGGPGGNVGEAPGRRRRRDRRPTGQLARPPRP